MSNFIKIFDSKLAVNIVLNVNSIKYITPVLNDCDDVVGSFVHVDDYKFRIEESPIKLLSKLEKLG